MLWWEIQKFTLCIYWDRFRDLLAFVREEYENELTQGNEDTEAVIADHQQFLQKLLAQTEGATHVGEVEKMEAAIPVLDTSSTSSTSMEASAVPQEEKEVSSSLLLPIKEVVQESVAKENNDG